MSDSESEEERSAIEDGSGSEEEESSEEEGGRGGGGMFWLNEPEEWSQHRTTVMMRVPPETDFWRKTMTGEIKDDAPFYGLEVDGDFEVRVKVKANYEHPDDQAGIMIRQDEENWIKCGIQMIGDVPHMCSTVTHDWSDMACHPLPHLPEFMWVHAKKIADGLEVYISEDSFDWMQIRQGDIDDSVPHIVGLYCAAPQSEGFDVTFGMFFTPKACFSHSIDPNLCFHIHFNIFRRFHDQG
jgi:uncharacterized protein